MNYQMRETSERPAQIGRAVSPWILEGDVGRLVVGRCPTLLVWFAPLALWSASSDSEGPRPALYQAGTTPQVRPRTSCLSLYLEAGCRNSVRQSTGAGESVTFRGGVGGFLGVICHHVALRPRESRKEQPRIHQFPRSGRSLEDIPAISWAAEVVLKSPSGTDQRP